MALTCPVNSVIQTLHIPPEFLDFYYFLNSNVMGTGNKRGWSLGMEPATPKAVGALKKKKKNLLTSFLFTFSLSESIGISLCTGKIPYLPQARERAESIVTNRSESMFVSASLFLGARDSVAIH